MEIKVVIFIGFAAFLLCASEIFINIPKIKKIFKALKKGKNSSDTIKPRDFDFVYIKNKTDEITLKIKSHDPDFNKYDFLNFARNTFFVLYADFKDDIMSKTARLNISELFQLFKSSEEIIKGKISPPADIDIKTAFFSDYNINQGFEFITVMFYVYTYDEKYTDDPYRQFAVKFLRFTNNLADHISESGSITCPNCGGNGESIIKSGICEYCGYAVIKGGYNFILSDFSKILTP